MIRFALLTSLFAVAASMAAAQVDAEKRALFVSILEKHDCRMHNLAPRPELVNDIFSSGLERDDIRPIAMDLMDKGEAERDGEFLVLKTSGC
ncbi:MAG: hypothetical protein AB3N09_02515 [Tateyamaria sp.]